jgi:hypothetical protein
MARIPRPGDPRDTAFPVAADDAARLVASAGPLLENAIDVEWYEQHGTTVDHAALTLCRIRRVVAGQKGGPEHGDEAVRYVLDSVSPEAVLWIASRAISYMDESGFPDAVEPWFPPEERDESG